MNLQRFINENIEQIEEIVADMYLERDAYWQLFNMFSYEAITEFVAVKEYKYHQLQGNVQ